MKPMFAFGLLLIATGFVLVACSHSHSCDESRIKDMELASVRDRLAASELKFQTETKHAILQVPDRNPATGRFDTPDTNVHNGLPIVSRWNAYRDSEGNVVYGTEYQVKTSR